MHVYVGNSVVAGKTVFIAVSDTKSNSDFYQPESILDTYTNRIQGKLQ